MNYANPTQAPVPRPAQGDFDILASILQFTPAEQVPRLPRIYAEPGTLPDRQLNGLARAFLHSFDQSRAIDDKSSRIAINRAKVRIAEAAEAQANVYMRSNPRFAAAILEVATRAERSIVTPLVLNSQTLQAAINTLVHDVSRIEQMLPTDENTRLLRAQQLQIDLDAESALVNLDRYGYH